MKIFKALLLSCLLAFSPSLIADDVDPDCSEGTGYTVNYDNIPITQLIRFISQISDTNFVFDVNDLNFNITIVSEEPTPIEDLMAALIQILRMHKLSVVEQGNNLLIYQQDDLSRVSQVVTDATASRYQDVPVVTRVFRLFNLEPVRVAEIVKPLLSPNASVEVSQETRHLIVTDITPNVDRINDLIIALEVPDIQIVTKKYRVEKGSATELVTVARQILAPIAGQEPLKLIPHPSTKSIFVVSTPFMVNEALQILESLDRTDVSLEDVAQDLPSSDFVNNNFYVYKLKFHNGEEISTALQKIGANLQRTGLANMDLVNAINSMEWIQANNSLVFSGTDKAIEKIKELLSDLDGAPKQVYIEVLIIDTELSNSLDFGVEWVALGNEQEKLAFATALLDEAPPSAPVSSLSGLAQPPLYGGTREAATSPPPDAARGGAPGTGGDIPLTSGFGFGIVGNIIRHNGQSFLTLGALVKALEMESNTKIVLNPRLMTEDNQEATFFVGQNIPYQTTSTVIRDTGSVTENIQYEDVGVQLHVTPMVGPNNMVTLEIDQSVANVLSTTVSVGGTQGSILAPTIQKTLNTTRVHVPDCAFLVMSGHVNDTTTYTRRGIPCLGSLPLIGPTFSRREEVRSKRNMIMFVRPRVIDSDQEAIWLSNKEGYQHNWQSKPPSIRGCPLESAPEAQTYPPTCD